MSSRGKRAHKRAPKYKDSDNSDTGEDFEDSGTDASVPDDVDEDSSAGSDDDFAEEAETEPSKSKTKTKRKSQLVNTVPKSKISMDIIKRNLQSAGNRADSAQDPEDSEEAPFSVKDLTEQEKLLPAFLNLSESDTDDSDNEDKNKRLSVFSEQPLDIRSFVDKKSEDVAKQPKKIPQPQVERLSDSGSESEMEDVPVFNIPKSSTETPNDPSSLVVKKPNFQHLQEHVKKLTEAKQSLESYKKRHSAPVSKEATLNIHELLAMGEAETAHTKEISEEEENSDSDVEDLEEVKGEVKSQTSIPKGGIQLVLDLPNDRPKPKTQLDLKMMLKRRMNRVKKEYQVYIHKVHILCWLGHGNFVNKVLNEQSLLAAALSLIPSEKSYPGPRVDIKYIEQVTIWFNGYMNVKEDENEYKYKPKKRPLNLALLQQIDKKCVNSKKNLVLIFVCLLRALGIKCRLIFSFRVAPLRPPDLLSLSTKNENEPSKKTKDGETSNHFESSASSSNKCQINQSKKPAKKSCPKISKISQLDGTDDRELDKRKSIQNKKLSLNKLKTEPISPKPSSSSNLSYWDQIMQNTVKDEPNVEKNKRVDHRDLNKIKSNSKDIKVESPSKNIFDQSTLILDKNDSLHNSTKNNKAKTNTISLSISKASKDSKSQKDKPPVSQNIENGIRTSSRLKTIARLSAPNLKIDEEEKYRKSKSVSPDRGSSSSKRSRAVKKTSDTNTNDKAKLNSVINHNNIEATSSNVIENISTKPKVTKKASTSEISDASKASLQSKAKGKTTQNRRSEIILKPHDSEKEVAKTNRRKTVSFPDLENKDKTEKTAVEKNVKVTQKKTKSSQKKPPAKSNQNTSKYFDSSDNNNSSKTSSRSTKDKRVSHRDLLNKSTEVETCKSNKKPIDVIKDLVGIMKDRIRESKVQSKSKLVKGKKTNSSDEDSDYIEEETSKRNKQSTSRRSSNASDVDFKPSTKRISGAKAVKDRRVISPDEEQSMDDTKRRGIDVWCEVYVEEEEQWISVDVVKAQVHCPNEIYNRTSRPVNYIVSWDPSGYVKDVTRRYVPHWNTTTRKLRVDQEWYDEALQPWTAPQRLRDFREDRQLDRMQLDAPLPTSIQEFKNHPLYALKRHLLKFEVIYPADAAILGFIRNEAVYARECVHICRSRETWVKEAKVVKPGEKPFKIVKARPKYDRLSGNMIKDIPLEIFGPWQVDDYVPPSAENGQVPRNPYGNVELFKSCMLPKGTVHLQLPGLNKVARKLGVDCAPAMTGFDYHSGWSHPVYDGFVVCEEFKEQLIEAWEKEQEEAEARAREKIEKRVYGNWKRLIRGLFIRERLKAKYDFQQENTEAQVGGSKGKKRSKQPKFVAKKRRSCDGSSGTDSN